VTEQPIAILCNPPLDDARYADIAALYRAVGWGHPGDAEELREVYEYSGYVLLALEAQRVVGLLRAEQENAQTTWLAEVAVLPGHQARGIGKALLQRFIADHPNTTLYTDATDGVEGFFRRHGLALRRPLVPGPRKR
jgi:GNAT superfamily N-acetyltransferase